MYLSLPGWAVLSEHYQMNLSWLHNHLHEVMVKTPHSTHWISQSLLLGEISLSEIHLTEPKTSRILEPRISQSLFQSDKDML